MKRLRFGAVDLSIWGFLALALFFIAVVVGSVIGWAMQGFPGLGS